jgi:effector-binding domain-containing protein
MNSEPKIEYREEKLYMGIRTVAPFKGMFAEVDKLIKELRKWVKQHDIADEGPFFLRYHVIDMNGPMDIEVGFMVSEYFPSDERVKSGVLPSGNYATLTYSGSGLAGNKALIGWAKDNGVAWDRWDDPAGDGFRCRYEAFLIAPNLQPRKTQNVNLAIKIADNPSQ